MAPWRVLKAHAYGNDFLFAPEEGFASDPADMARSVCDRHRGVGADGLILFSMQSRGASMRLWNADGSIAELSGNGLRCLAALVAREQNLARGATIAVQTAAGVKTLDLLDRAEARYTFRASLGPPDGLEEVAIPVLGEVVTASVLRIGNPQCVVLGPLPSAARFAQLGPALSTHPVFPLGTNVEFAEVEAPDRLRITIWERGVGPTASSGTGTAAAAVAAAAHGGARRSVDVAAPGGTQRVEWEEEGVFLTGWAEVVLDGQWLL